MKISMERFTNLVLLVTCLVVGGGAVYDRVAAGHTRPRALPPEATYVGRKIQLPAGMARPRGVILFVRPGCSACEQNMPLYQSLVAMPGRQFDVAVIGPDREATGALMTARHVVPDVLAGGDFRTYGVVATPTVMLTDAEGKVQRAWIGSLLGERKTEFLKAIGE